MNTLTYKGYQGRFVYDAQADIFHGDVLHLGDVVTFQGRSIDELKTALRDSVEDYFDLCARVGKQPEKPYSGRFNVRIPPELQERITQKALYEGQSPNTWLVTTLHNAVGQQS